MYKFVKTSFNSNVVFFLILKCLDRKVKTRCFISIEILNFFTFKL
uniref:Uncharacterized protein n=1 Tax=Cyanoptyche gloeocystis TaxID=77922 RepID=A0A3G1IWG8_9EUKA|nr:hypothetical protein [Cyanoptyche gloeocystis]